MASNKQYYEDSKSENKYGYPTPGKQKVTAEDIMNTHYFMDDEEWEKNRILGDFDYVVIGSSFCALAFTTQALENNPDAKILIIERGTYLHPDHYQNLPPAFETTVHDPSETFHWRVTQKTKHGEYIKGLHGAYSFFGGRSSFWSGWCPEPTQAEMEGWPEEVIKVIRDYFPKAKEFLNVIPADKIFKDRAHHHPMFGELQSKVQSMLREASGKVEAVSDVIPAPLAVEAKKQRYEYYNKYCVVSPLLELLLLSKTKTKPSVQAVINCLVKKIHHDQGKAIVLETSKGDLKLGRAKLVLAMGILPSTTLVLNSFQDLKSSTPSLDRVGKRFAAHFISTITARIPLSNTFFSESDRQKLGTMPMELGAVYVTGVNKDSKRQFHVQITAMSVKTPADEAYIHDRIRHLPDVLASPSPEQLQSSKDHIVFACACLGELDHENDQNWFRLEGNDDITCNASLQVVANDTDNALWDTMDEATFQLFEKMLSLEDGLEYWHPEPETQSGSWKHAQPSKAQRRHDGLVHEASTMWIGGDNDAMAPVGLDYLLRGTDNVYITGASLWPRGGSWNPVGTIVSMAMHLADQIC